MLLFIFRLLSHLPLFVLHTIGAALAWLVYWFAPGYRRRLKENITRAGYEKYLSAAVTESGKSLSELPFVWGAPVEKVRSKVRVENWEIIQKAADMGKGVICIAPHLGCFEIVVQAVGNRMPSTVMYRPPRKAEHKPLFEEGRKRSQVKLAPTSLSGVRTLAKALKNGEAIGLLPDHVPRLGEGVWTEFFGRPAYTLTLPAKLRQMSGAPIIMVYSERLPRGKGYVLHFYPFEEEMGETAEQQARAINAAMEKLIARCPAQYFWSYDRFRKPRPPLRPPAPSPTSAKESE
jgi:Kdo2-lipid IVA lauroyltransferase/acyltransferase